MKYKLLDAGRTANLLTVALLLKFSILSCKCKVTLAVIRFGENNWEGIELRTSAYEYPPFFSIRKSSNGNVTYSGMVPEILVFNSENFHTSYKFVPVDHNDVLKYGRVSALLQQIEKKLVDYVPYMFEINLRNMEHMELTYPLWIMDYHLLQPFPNEESRLTNIVKPFTTMTWILILISTGTFVGFMSLVSYVKFFQEWNTTLDTQNIKGTYKKRILEVFYLKLEYVLTIVFAQGNYVPYNTKTAIKVSMAFWLLPTVVIVNGYASVMAALLAVPKLEPTIDTLDQWVSSNRFKITLEKGTLLTEQIMNAADGAYRTIGNTVRQDPTLLFANSVQMLENILKRNAMSLQATDVAKYFVREGRNAEGKCKMTISLKPVPNLFRIWQFGLPKGSPYKDFISFIQLRLWDHGFASYWKNKYLPTDMRCRVNSPRKGKMKPLEISDLTIIFVIIGTGTFLSSVVFIIDKVLSKVLRRTETFAI